MAPIFHWGRVLSSNVLIDQYIFQTTYNTLDNFEKNRFENFA